MRGNYLWDYLASSVSLFSVLVLWCHYQLRHSCLMMCIGFTSMADPRPSLSPWLSKVITCIWVACF